MDYLLIGSPGTAKPHAMTDGNRRIGATEIPGEVILTSFPSHSWDAAVAIFNTSKEHGISVIADKHGCEHIGQWWTFTGAPGHLQRAAARLGVSLAAINRAEAEGPVYNLSSRIGEVYARYKAVKGPNKPDRDFTFAERRDIDGLISRCEFEDARLHAMAAAGRSMLDSAREAVGRPPLDSTFRIVAIDDVTPPLTIKVELTELRGEFERLRTGMQELADRNAQLEAKNRDLTDQLAKLAALESQPTVPGPPPAAKPQNVAPRSDHLKRK